MARKCTSCGMDLEPGSTFCQNCGTPVPTSTAPAQAEQIGVMGQIERAVYFRVARVFSWVLLVAAIVGFLYSVALAIGSAGDLVGGKQSVSKEEVQAVITNGRVPNASLDEESVADESDPKLIGEFETELAQLVLLFPQEVRQQAGGDDRLRDNLKQSVQQMAEGKKNQISAVQDARDLLGEFAEKDRSEAFQNFFILKQQKAQLAAVKQAEAKAKFAYLGGATLMTAMLITLVSMVLVLLAIERSLRTK